MWVTNAELCRLKGKIGTLTPGAFGDIVVSNVNPLDNIVAFADHEKAIDVVVKSGAIVVRRDR